MFYDPERAYSPSSLLKGLGFAALLFVVFVVGVCVGNAEIEEQPSSEPQQTSGVGPTPTYIPVDINSPEFKIHGVWIGDCRLLIFTDIFVSLSEEEYEDILRRERCSEERIEELLATFAESQVEGRTHLNRVATEGNYWIEPTQTTQDTTGRCSASPDCSLEVSSSELEDYYRSDSSRWDLSMTEGRGAGAGKRIFTANSKTDAGYYVTWIEREGVGVQLVEMVAPLPMACSDWESFANVRYNLVDLMQLTISSPIEPRDPHNLYDLGCYLTSSNNKINLVINGVLASANYVDVEDIRLLDFTFWPCGERAENGRCQWYKS